MSGKSLAVLFVCTGNICRSPTAEAIFRKIAADAGLGQAILTDSAGTHAYHVGEPPDSRALAAAARRGYDMSGLRARKVERADFDRYDLILAMDGEHRAFLEGLRSPGAEGQVRLMMSYARRFSENDVPDPYYGGPQGFERVLDMLEDAAEGLLETLGKSFPRRSA
jgi:protein-tyrosine phosphatase